MNQLPYLRIGELAKQTGLTVSNLRYYSNIGLLKPAHIEDNGYRYYRQNALVQVEFIKKAQTLGFTLEEIKQILDVRDRGEIPCELVKDLLNHKIEQLEIKIKQMSLFKSELEEYRATWDNNSEPKSEKEEVCSLIASVTLPDTN